jgi:GNAT superfamily N-acetyltransferase
MNDRVEFSAGSYKTKRRLGSAVTDMTKKSEELAVTGSGPPAQHILLPPNPLDLNQRCERKSVTVEQVSTRRQRREFVEFPRKIYAADDNWCPPLTSEALASIDPRKHPFYQHGAATQFLARHDRQIVGRILVSDDPHYNREHDANVGCFGMFESANDPIVVGKLLEAADDWLRLRGRTSMMGPIDYSTNYQAGLLVEGFNTPQRILMNHNPRHYAELLESWGLAKAMDLYAWWFDTRNPRIEEWGRRAARLAKRGGITVRPVRMQAFDVDLENCRQVYNEASVKAWGFVQMTPAEFRYMAHQLKQFAIPELLLMAEVQGKAVGFCVTLPDVNEAIRPMGGQMTWWGLPIGLVKLMRSLKRIRTGRMIVLGVLPKYRRRGIAELMILQACQYATSKLDYLGAELSWTYEYNDMVNRTIESVGGALYKRFRLYERPITCRS